MGRCSRPGRRWRRKSWGAETGERNAYVGEQEHRGDLAPELNRVAAMPRAGSNGEHAEGVPYLSHRTGQACQNNKMFRPTLDENVFR
jgi:hypothetical protein